MSVHGEVQLPAVWAGLEEAHVLAANQFALQVVGPGEIVLSVGHLTQPLLAGTPDEQRAQLERLPFVVIQGLGRFALTRQNVASLRELFGAVLAAHDENFGEGNP